MTYLRTLEEKKTYTIPKNIIDFFEKKYNEYPCITQTPNVVYGAIEQLNKKNKILWYNNLFNGSETIIKEAIIDFSTNFKTMVFVSNVENERVYRLFILSTTENKFNVDILIKGLNKFYTIDLV
jgi:hypothetical protein